MTVTIKDVAKKAKVAPSTVSRVIADHPKITQETKEKVRKVMQELGYHPNLLARKLVTQSSQTIGVIRKMSSKYLLSDPFFPEALQGINDLLRAKKYSILTVNGEAEDEIYQEVVNMVQGKSVDGMILLYSQYQDPVFDFLVEQDFPFTMLGKPTEHSNKVMYVDNDNVKAACDMTEYLIQLGHTRIAYIGGDPKFEVHKDREQGYRQALIQANIQTEHIFRQEVSKENARNVVQQIMAQQPRPTAIVTTDELRAMSILSALYEQKLRVPDDIAVTAFTNSMLSELSSPPLTTMDIHPFQLGYETAKSLVDLLENPKMMKRNILVPATIVTRESCKKM
ncbi:LacI family DNA-binding transcriptional regulator [Lysinibacillus piscis]|uniref:LacI family transcriptional regulator n=1 Tax=Lysinibacillus piscis TaxID=2518931 RepID=A0ABQ5NKW7_9BACI|nr:LacI family DNA-binding transcriptional regulator [Lysinibacillus sp. KH24]GLC88943.1 LacI family transcriptional regulator [Lysinibacillus sp. KH24]